mmetsp:Transcript_10717/g.35147  ORF Transcript_10717/g.35147 Transcript_10717/m.35147 type:complete len:142 (+) Transcript_10717:1514-1939(+)
MARSSPLAFVVASIVEAIDQDAAGVGQTGTIVAVADYHPQAPTRDPNKLRKPAFSSFRSKSAEPVTDGAAPKRRRDAGGLRKSGDAYAVGWRRLSAHQVRRLVSIFRKTHVSLTGGGGAEARESSGVHGLQKSQTSIIIMS